MERAPLLVLAAGQRCGSTLVQRLLSSHPQVLIWGEHAGQLRQLLAIGDRLRTWTTDFGDPGRLGFARSGYQSFMANMTPEADRIDRATRAYLEQLFARPAQEAGRPIWGFKEVRYGLLEANAVRRLFPDCRVLHIVRDPRDVLRSLDVWERAGGWPRSDTELVVADWKRVAASFWTSDVEPWVLRLRYEDLVAEPALWSMRIAEHCGLSIELFDDAVFGRRIHGAGLRGQARREIRDWASLPSELRDLVDADVQLIGKACGYQLEF
jgi:hypothetical protein